MITDDACLMSVSSMVSSPAFLLVVLAMTGGAACAKPDAPMITAVDAGATPIAADRPAKKEALGNVMAQVARRFELVGRAARADRYDFMAFEIGELEELFDDDIPNAELPKEGPTMQIPALAAAFRKTNLTALEDAAKSRDPKAVAAAFASAATACNDCHRASAKAFIEISSVTGKPVPDLDPISAPTSSAASGASSVRPSTSPTTTHAPDLGDPFSGRN